VNTTNLLIVAVGIALLYLGAAKLGLLPDLAGIAGTKDTPSQ